MSEPIFYLDMVLALTADELPAYLNYPGGYVTGGPTQAITAAGAIAGAGAFGTDLLSLGLSAAGAVPSAQALGAPALKLGLSGAGAVASAQAFGSPSVSVGGALSISAAGAIASVGALGEPRVYRPPLIELIAAEIEGTINSITVANGWHQDLRAVRPTHLALEGDAAPVDGTVVLIQQDPTEDPENSPDGGIATRCQDQPFALAAFVFASDADSTPLDRRMNLVRADLEKRLMQDPTRGGYAMDTKPAPSARMRRGDAPIGIVAFIDVKYRTRLFDPYVRA